MSGGALEKLLHPDVALKGPLGSGAWVFDSSLTHVLMVRHRLRGWVPPGGKVEPGETPREAARRELFEETGVRAALRPVPVAVTVRTYDPDWPETVGVTFLEVLDQRTELAPEKGQPAAWLPLDEPWQGWYCEDRLLMRQCTDRLRTVGNGARGS